MSLESLILGMFKNADGVDRGPAIQAHRERYKDTHFQCDCGGDVYPFSEQKGLCVSCKDEPDLIDLHYDTTEAEEDEGAE